MVYGPGDGQRRLYYYLKLIDDGRPAIILEEGLARWRWTRAYVENVAAAIALAVITDRATERIYNVGAPEVESEAEWVRRIGAVAGWNGEVIAMPREKLPAHLVPDINTDHHLVLDDSRIRSELGFTEPVAGDVALRRTIAWQRAHPPAHIDPKAFDYAADDAVLARHR